MNRKIISLIFFILTILFLGLGTLSRSQTQQRQDDYQLNLQNESVDISPELNFVIGLGVFRSVLIDFIWMRASKLQQEKRFYEIVQLYDMIGKLQPHNSMIWAYSAWNMAYNISVELPPGLERWRWVQNGIKRITEHGLHYNPKDRLLYKEIAWIYSHKISKNLDDSHLLYKIKLAETITDAFRPFSASAKAIEEALKSKDSQLVTQAKQVISRLKETFCLDYEFMLNLEKNDDFGPLDWRIGETHAIYWTKLGLAKGTYGSKPIELERIMYQSMQYLLRKGTIVYIEATDTLPANITQWPDYKQVFPMNRMFIKQINLFQQSNTSVTGVRSAYFYFLKEALEILVFAGQNSEAEKLFKLANQTMPGILSGRNAEEHIKHNLVQRVKEMSGDQFSALVSSLFLQHYWWLGNANTQKANAMLIYAQQLWKINAKENPYAERSTNNDLQQIKRNVLITLFEKKMFHPKVLKRIYAEASVNKLLNSSKVPKKN